METNELKSLWEEYDKKVSDSLKLNEELLRKMTQEKSRKEMNGMLRYEYFGIFFTTILILLLIWFTILLSHTPFYLITGIISIILFTISLALYIQKNKYIANIDFYQDPVLKLQKAMSQYEQYHYKIKKFEFLTLPLIVLSFCPIFVKITRNIDILSMPIYPLIGGLMIGLIVGYMTMFGIYKFYSEKKIKNIINFIIELEEFEER